MTSAERSRKWRLEHPGYLTKYVRQWRASHPEYYEKQKQYYQEHKDEFARRAKKYRNKIRERLVKRLEEMRRLKEETGCQRCPEKDWRVLTYHHLDPKKKSFNLGQKYMYFNRIRVLKEIAKCIVLCFNCHRRAEWEHENGIEEILYG